jgi:hypothetical protein
MAAHAQRVAELERQVAELDARLEQYHRSACVISAVGEIIGAPLTAAARQALQQQQPRHLHAVPDLEPEPELGAGA